MERVAHFRERRAQRLISPARQARLCPSTMLRMVPSPFRGGSATSAHHPLFGHSSPAVPDNRKPPPAPLPHNSDYALGNCSKNGQNQRSDLWGKRVTVRERHGTDEALKRHKQKK